MAVALADIRADIGEFYSAMENGTTAVGSLITKAEGFVSAMTGTTTGYDNAIRDITNAYVCNHIIGGLDPVSKSVGANITVGAKSVRDARDNFIEMAERYMKIKGYSIDGIRIKFELANG